MRVDDFDFDLPDELIALRPASPRDASRMLIVREDGSLAHAHVGDLPNYLAGGDALVLNDTKVVQARLRGHRLGRGDTEPKIEVLLHQRLDGATFRALSRPARKLDPGDRLKLGASLEAVVAEKADAGEIVVRFARSGGDLDRAIAEEGETPLPPYIAGKRRADDRDRSDYQTVFAAHEGSVAAPTAGLHFTPDLLARLSASGVRSEYLTLHVGPGTFLPVTSPDTSGHKMHPEWAHLSAHAAQHLNDTRSAGGRVCAVGTTSLRTLESAVGSDGRYHEFSGETTLFITPGYRFKAVDILLTNFHLPRSTLFMLVSAFSGLEVMRRAYDEAIAARYRFYSYGDACLLFRASVVVPKFAPLSIGGS
jgi:S-adenosylmethionine:tRNA ribosyltransferase-isomerase